MTGPPRAGSRSSCTSASARKARPGASRGARGSAGWRRSIVQPSAWSSACGSTTSQRPEAWNATRCAPSRWRSPPIASERAIVSANAAKHATHSVVYTGTWTAPNAASEPITISATASSKALCSARTLRAERSISREETTTGRCSAGSVWLSLKVASPGRTIAGWNPARNGDEPARKVGDERGAGDPATTS